MDLFASSLQHRQAASELHQVFPFDVSLGGEAEAWQALRGHRALAVGKPWPEALRTRVEHWPEHAFGPANASVLLLWHRPGMGAGGSAPGAYIGPRFPVLGGIAHLHVAAWPQRHPDPSWSNLVRYVGDAFTSAGFSDPWPHVMIACLNPVPDATGREGRAANRAAVAPGGRLDFLVETVRPLIMLACGGAVQRALRWWRPPISVRILEVAHPLHWGPFGGSFQGPHVAQELSLALTSASGRPRRPQTQPGKHPAETLPPPNALQRPARRNSQKPASQDQGPVLPRGAYLLVESDELHLNYRGNASQGVEAEGYPRKTPVYLHFLRLQADELTRFVPMLVRGARSTQRFTLTGENRWWVVKTAAKAHWPGTPKIKSRMIGREPEYWAEETVRQLLRAPGQG